MSASSKLWDALGAVGTQAVSCGMHNVGLWLCLWWAALVCVCMCMCDANHNHSILINLDASRSN